MSQGQIVYGWANSDISLQPNTMYYFKACAKNDPGDVSQGSVKDFRTKNAVTTRVTTRNASSITRTSASLNGYISAGNSIDTWFSQLSTTRSNASCTGNPDGMGSGDTGESVTRTVSGLNFGTTYYYRFCGKGYDGLKSGIIRSFETDIADTDVKTLSATNVSETTGVLRGEIISGDNIEYWWVRSTNSASTSCSSSPKEGSGYGNTGDTKSLALSKLGGGTTYYYRFCSSGQGGTDNGSRKSFATNDVFVACGGSYSGSSEGATVVLPSNRDFDVVFASFEAYTIPDRLDIYYSGGTGHSSTGGMIAGHMNFQFPFNSNVRFYVTGNADNATKWDLSISCYSSDPF